MASDDAWIVLAYIFPFVTWLIVTHDDFVGRQQRTLADSRRLGRQHLAIISIPLFFLAFVVFHHARSRDYKTMSMALLVFLFVVLHLARTFYCLWQLAALRQWLTASLARMESIGYLPRPPPPCSRRHADDLDLDDPADAHPAAWADPLQRRLWHADSFLVRDNLVDGIWTARGMRFSVHLLSVSQLSSIRSRSTMAGGASASFCLTLASLARLPRLLHALALSDDPGPVCAHTAPFAAPSQPEKLFVRWACTLATHFPHWVRDVHISGAACVPRRSGPPRRPRAPVGGRCAPSGDTPISPQALLDAVFAHASPSVRDAYRARLAAHPPPPPPQPRIAPAELMRGATVPGCCKRHRGIPKSQFMRRTEVLRCRSCKQGLLSRVLASGCGLPLGLPHRNARNWDAHNAPLGYEMFRQELSRAKGALSWDAETHVANLGVRELEWLAVFLGC